MPSAGQEQCPAVLQQVPSESLFVPEHELVGENRKHIVINAGSIGDTDSMSESELYETNDVLQLPSDAFVLTDTLTEPQLHHPELCDESSSHKVKVVPSAGLMQCPSVQQLLCQQDEIREI